MQLFQKFQYFLLFLKFNDHYWPTKIFSLGDGLFDRTFERKNCFEFFTAKLKTFV